MAGRQHRVLWLASSTPMDITCTCTSDGTSGHRSTFSASVNFNPSTFIHSRLIAAAMWHLGTGRFVHVLLLLSWAHLGLLSARNIPIFAVVSAPGIGLAMRDWLEYLSSCCALDWSRNLTASIAELETGLRMIACSQDRRRWHLVPCLAVLVLALLLSHPGRVKALHAEFDRSRFPSDAATFLSQANSSAPTRLYSIWQWGGYLIYRLWPSLAVSNDGRTDFYGPAFVEQGLCVWDACPEWAKVFEQYRVNAALLPIGSALATVLRERSDWKLIYQDGLPCCSRKRKPRGEVPWRFDEVPMPEAKEVASIEKSAESIVNASNAGGNGSAESRGTPAVRRRLPDERHSLTHHFSVGGQEGYVTIGLYQDGLPGENVHQDGEGRLDSIRAHGFLCNRRVTCFAVRRAVAGPLRQIQPHTI